VEDLHSWNEKDTEVLRPLWIGSLPPLPKDLSNAFSDNTRAAKLGKMLFFDERLSGNSKVSFATCHRPHMNFTDDLSVAHGNYLVFQKRQDFGACSGQRKESPSLLRHSLSTSLAMTILIAGFGVK
jgi:Di-haem cytochrome c peroxidase